MCYLAPSIHGLVLNRSTMQGFHVAQKNVFSFASVQFLTVSVELLPFGVANDSYDPKSFFPALLFVPLALMVKGFDGAIRIWNVRKKSYVSERLAPHD